MGRLQIRYETYVQISPAPAVRASPSDLTGVGLSPLWELRYHMTRGHKTKA